MPFGSCALSVIRVNRRKISPGDERMVNSKLFINQ